MSEVLSKHLMRVFTLLVKILDAEIDFVDRPSSITYGRCKRDEHLRGTDFFDVEKLIKKSRLAQAQWDKQMRKAS